ncbi:MAG TPA: hypothetical protein VGG64_17415 [Pirellulales bacterium]
MMRTEHGAVFFEYHLDGSDGAPADQLDNADQDNARRADQALSAYYWRVILTALRHSRHNTRLAGRPDPR